MSASADAVAAPATMPGRALVVGAGLGGAACAWSLAQRGWQVRVLDRAAHPAAGASGLPVGLVAPHTSADDTRISQISRIGIRHTLARAAALLRQEQDWAPSGVLEHCVEGRTKLPPQWADAAQATHDADVARFWSQPATAAQIAASGLPVSAAAIWHGCAAWLKPPALVQALLRQPGVQFMGNSPVAALRRTPGSADAPPQWQALDADGHVQAQADIAVLAAGFDSAALLTQLQGLATPAATASEYAIPASSAVQADADTATSTPAATPHTANGAPTLHLPLNPLRGQIAWGWLDNRTGSASAAAPTAATSATPSDTAQTSALPPFPVNGKGSMAAHIPYAAQGRHGQIWITGSTFERGATDPAVHPDDMPQILDKLRLLHPAAAQTLQPAFARGRAQGWAGVRATLPDRLPAVGAWPGVPGLHLCCGMGARGLALAMLAGEMLATALHQQPLPLPPHLAAMLAAERWPRKALRGRELGKAA